MPASMMDKTCADFATALAAKESVPGGGAAGAYVGALGVALASMVGHYTAGKKAYAEHEADIQRMLTDAERIRARLLELADEDAAAFEPLARAYSIPKDDPTRAGVLEAATLKACNAPIEMMRQIGQAIALLEEMGQKGSRMLLSDVGCGALLCAAAIRAASLNVFINTKGLQDRTAAAGLDAVCDTLLAMYIPRAAAIAEDATSRIRSSMES